MPRLSLYRTERGNDYEFIDRTIEEQFTVGGTDLSVYKYLGPEITANENATADQPQYDVVKETNIQDLLFLENRDRKYDQDIYKMRGIYNIQDIDFNLSQFGLFLSNDTLFLTVHIRSSIKTLGRKVIPGDVIELPHLRDEYALNDFDFSLKRFYVVEDVNRAAEGFSPTWYPHLYRLKLKQIYDGQEYKDILDLPASDDTDITLREVLSTYEKEMQINSAVVAQSEIDSLRSGFEIRHYYSVNKAEDGRIVIKTADNTQLDASNITSNSSDILEPPSRLGYSGYLLGFSDAPNGAPFGTGIQFPRDNQAGDFFLRTDFFPNRMFRYDGVKWNRLYDDVRMILSNVEERQTQKTSFFNNNNTNTINGEVVEERQSITRALRPRADNT
jgi:hypothetical protein